MAQFDVHGFEPLFEKLEKLSNFEKIAPKMLEAGMEELQVSVVKEASEHRDTGDMVASIKPTGLAKTKGGGYYMCTRPTGKDRKGVRNMEKIVYLEFGVKGRPATPVITKAVLNAEPHVIAAMREVFEREVESI